MYNEVIKNPFFIKILSIFSADIEYNIIDLQLFFVHKGFYQLESKQAEKSSVKKLARKDVTRSFGC